MSEHMRTAPSTPSGEQQPMLHSGSPIIVRLPASNRQAASPIHFFRHPCDMPVKLTRRRQDTLPAQWLDNVAPCGLACYAEQGYRFGSSVELQIPLDGRQTCYLGVVIWCRRAALGYLTGVAFLDEDTQFRARMTEQICQIEHYRRQREKELGEELPIESAAFEWVARHAADFSLPAP